MSCILVMLWLSRDCLFFVSAFICFDFSLLHSFLLVLFHLSSELPKHRQISIDTLQKISYSSDWSVDCFLSGIELSDAQEGEYLDTAIRLSTIISRQSTKSDTISLFEFMGFLLDSIRDLTVDSLGRLFHVCVGSFLPKCPFISFLSSAFIKRVNFFCNL